MSETMRPTGQAVTPENGMKREGGGCFGTLVESNIYEQNLQIKQESEDLM
jgi:hypothetical protein